MKKSHVICLVAVGAVFLIFIGAVGMSMGSEDGNGNPSNPAGAYSYELYEIGGFNSTLGFTQSADDGKKYIIASITLANYNNSSIYAHQSKFEIVNGNAKYSADIDSVIHPEYQEPTYVEKGSSFSLALLFSVPDTVDIDDTKLVWKGSPKGVVLDPSLNVPEIETGYKFGSGVGCYNYQLYKVDGFDGGYMDFLPDSGYTFIVASIILKNTDYPGKIDTNPYSFDLKLNGTEYERYFDSYNHPEHKKSVYLPKDTEHSFITIFMVPDEKLNDVDLVWSGYPEEVVRDESLKVPSINAGYNPVKL